MDSTTGSRYVATSSPASVRARILEEHVRIKAQLLRIDRLLRAAKAGASGALEGLLVETSALVDTFRAHLDLEDRELAPLLESIDAWGPIRREELAREHARQRAELDVLAARLQVGPSVDPELVQAVAVFTAELLADMEEEEQSSLDKDTLRDDVIAIAQFGG
jgi:hypothetical protein